MTSDEVKALAESLMTSVDNGQWKYEVGSPARDRQRPQEWNVLVRWMFPDGTPLDGPGIVIVSETTGEARFF